MVHLFGTIAAIYGPEQGVSISTAIPELFLKEGENFTFTDLLLLRMIATALQLNLHESELVTGAAVQGMGHLLNIANGSVISCHNGARLIVEGNVIPSQAWNTQAATFDLPYEVSAALGFRSVSNIGLSALITHSGTIMPGERIWIERPDSGSVSIVPISPNPERFEPVLN